MEKRNKDVEFARFIYNLLDRSGRTRESLAEEVGCSARAIYQFCNGDRSPGHRTLIKIIKAVGGISAEDIPF